MQREVVLTGIGGQGVQLCAKTLAVAATGEGRQAMLAATYGGEMRGGKTEASVVVSDGRLRSLPILPATWSAYVMHHQFWPPVKRKVRPGGVVVVNSDVVTDDAGSGIRRFDVPAGAIAVSLGAPMSAGFVLLGAYCSVTGLVEAASLVAAMRQLVPAYRREHIAANSAAIEAGFGALPAMAAPAWREDPAPERQPA